MQTYQEYKNPSMIWLSSIPSHWESIKMKYLFLERVEKGFPNEPLLVASQNMGVVPKSVYGSRTVEATKDLHLLKKVHKGDFVISLRSFQGGIEHAYYQGIISPAYTVLSIKSNYTNGYFRLLAKSAPFIKLLQMCVTGIREGQNIDYKTLKNFSLPIPPRNEQDKIVNFLDWKVSKITKLINAKKKHIALLKEQKQAIINNAVTKGLDKNAKMKDSGIDWLGDIPEHWEVRKLKRLCNLVSSKSSDTSLPYIGMENIESWTGKYISSELIVEKGENSFFTDNCILFGKLRPYLAKVFITNNSGTCSGEFLVLRDFKLNKYFFFNLLRSFRFIDLVNLSTYGAKMPRANWTFIGYIELPLPPLNEQEEIVKYIEEATAKLDELISTLEKKIKFFEEYKISLTSNVVTGAINVQDIVVPEYTIEENSVDYLEEELEEDEEIFEEEE